MQRNRELTVRFSTVQSKYWGISGDAKRRALKRLRDAGLITFEQEGKRSPIVTILCADGESPAEILNRNGGADVDAR
jgi:DNA-binding transcriptional ArsR family regulator